MTEEQKTPWAEVGDLLSKARSRAKLTRTAVSRYLAALDKLETTVQERSLSDYENGVCLPESERLLALLNLYAARSLPPLPPRKQESEDEKVAPIADPVFAGNSDPRAHRRFGVLLLKISRAIVDASGQQGRAARRSRDEIRFRHEGQISTEDVHIKAATWTKPGGGLDQRTTKKG